MEALTLRLKIPHASGHSLSTHDSFRLLLRVMLRKASSVVKDEWLVAPGDPFVQVRGLVADGGGVAVAGVDDRGQVEAHAAR
jgi:hypothetical protein